MYNLLLSKRFTVPLKKIKLRNFIFFNWWGKWFLTRFRSKFFIKGSVNKYVNVGNRRKNLFSRCRLATVVKKLYIYFHISKASNFKSQLNAYKKMYREMRAFVKSSPYGLYRSLFGRFLVRKFYFFKNSICLKIKKLFNLFRSIDVKKELTENIFSSFDKKDFNFFFRDQEKKFIFHHMGYPFPKQVNVTRKENFMPIFSNKKRYCVNIDFVRFYLSPRFRSMSFDHFKRLLLFKFFYNNRGFLTPKSTLELKFHSRKRNYFITTSNVFTGETFLNSSAGCWCGLEKKSRRIYYTMRVFKRCVYHVWYETFKKPNFLRYYPKPERERDKKGRFLKRVIRPISLIARFSFMDNMRNKAVFFNKFFFNLMKKSRKKWLNPDYRTYLSDFEIYNKPFYVSSLKKKKKRRL
jgi:hypothetical protein